MDASTGRDNVRPTGSAMRYDCARGIHIMTPDSPLYDRGRVRRRAHCMACPYEAVEAYEDAEAAPKIGMARYSTPGQAVQQRLADGRILVISSGGPNRAARRRSGRR